MDINNTNKILKKKNSTFFLLHYNLNKKNITTI